MATKVTKMCRKRENCHLNGLKKKQVIGSRVIKEGVKLPVKPSFWPDQTQCPIDEKQLKWLEFAILTVRKRNGTVFVDG